MKKSYLTGTAIVACLLASNALAQDALGGSSGSEESAQPTDEIIVTAERRETSIQRVAAAVSAVSGESLAELGINDQSQLSRVAPSLAIGAQGSNGVAFLRGIGQTQGSPNTQPGVSINLNGVYLPRESGTTALYDLERVEVLPGPQGTLWGRNAAGGAINFLTRRPVFEFEGSASLEVGNDDLVHPTAVLNVPLGDTLAVRVAGEYNYHKGYLSNGANDRDAWSGRASVLFEPSDAFSGLVVVGYTREGGIGAQSVFYSERGVRGQFNPTGDIYQQTFPTTLLRRDGEVFTATGEFTLALSDNINLTWVPGYVEVDSDEVTQFQGNSPSSLIKTVEQHSQELRLSSAGDGKFNWVLGGFYYTATHDFRNVVRIDLPTPVGSVRFFNDLESLAVFGEGKYSVSDTFRVTLGGRYSIDEFNGFARTATPPRSEAAPLIGANGNRDSRFDWKVGVEADVAPRSMLYATVQTGYLVGGFTQDGRLFPPAVLTAYTAGARNRFLDNTLTANIELFYYDYKDYQLQYVQGTTFLSISTPATIYGMQLDLTARPGPNDVFNFNVAAQRATIDDKTNLYPVNGIARSINGFTIPNAPDVTINVGWNHSFPLANGATVDFNAQSYFNSGYFMVFTHDLNTRQRAFTKTDLTLTYKAPNDRWSVGAFVRNLEDEAVVVGGNKPQPNALTAPYVNPPRTYGLRAAINF